MKIFAIQKTQTNTYSPQYQQNSSANQNPVTKTNLTGDKFVSSKISFSGITINSLRADLAALTEQVNKRQITEEVYENLASPIRSKISDLILKSIQEFNKRPKGIWEALFGSKESDATWNRLISQAPEIDDINVWEAKVARLKNRLETENLLENTRKELEDEILHLKRKIHSESSEGEPYWSPAAHAADHPYD